MEKIEMEEGIDRDLVIEVAEAIENDGGRQFGMNHIWNDCGSPACIVGWTLLVKHGWRSDKDMPPWTVAQNLARNDMRLTEEQAMSLFAPREDEEGWDYKAKRGDRDYITVDHAVATLKHLWATGDVSWHEGMKHIDD